MDYVPLKEVWPAHGLVSVVIALLEDAGFHPVAECDSRGWWYYRPWPLGGYRPTVVWIPLVEHDSARAFLDAPYDPEEIDATTTNGFYASVHAHRRLVYLGWGVLLTFAAT